MAKVVHSPWSSRDPYELADFDSVDEAREYLRSRAAAVEARYPGAVCALSDDGLRMETSDDEALMIGDYQGLTYVEV